MPKKRPLTDAELAKVKPLERRLRGLARAGRLPEAKEVASDIQRILRKAGDETRLQKAKAWLYEAALEAGELQFAIPGFIGIRKSMNPRTRIYLEATALLAVCHLRAGELDVAKPLMAEAIEKVKNIKSRRRQRQFYRRLVDRFEEEWAVSVLRGGEDSDLDPGAVQNEAGLMVATKPEDEIFLELGNSLPKPKVDQLLQAYEFSHKQLPSAERLLLPSPEQRKKRREVGRIIFRSARRAVWKALCDPESDTYKMWFHKGLMVAMDQKVIGGAVLAAMTGLGIGAKAIVIPVAALLIKMGVDVYCQTFSADGLMIGLDE